MPLVVKDRVLETTSSTGTGTITLGGAVAGYQSFSVIGNGNTTYYTISGGSEWEVGIGTYTSVGTTLSRDTVLESSNGGSLVNFSAGTKNVFVTYPAEKSVDLDTAQTLTNKTVSVDNNTVSGIAASSFVLSNASGNIDGAAAQKAIPSGVVVGTTDSQTLTNKTINLASNTLSTTLAQLNTAISDADVPSTTGSGASGTWGIGISGTAATATNIAGGGAGQVPYNTGAGATSFLAAGSVGQVFKSNGTSAPSWGSVINSGTAVSATGTSVDFTGIPSFVERITIAFSGVSTNGTSIIQVQLGTSSGFVTTGYFGGSSSVDASMAYSTYSAGFLIGDSVAASQVFTGTYSIININSTLWIENHTINSNTAGSTYIGGGYLSLGGTLDRVRITTVGGTNTFDAGTINIFYE